MKPTELRIGNLIYRSGDVHKVTTLQEDSIGTRFVKKADAVHELQNAYFTYTGQELCLS